MTCLGLSAPSYAQTDNSSPTRPPDISELENIPKIQPAVPDPDVAEGVTEDVRRDALREAAMSYGARGGLASRTYEIRQSLESRADYMDKVYDFRQLLIPAPSGFLIEPPIVSESLNATIIDNGGLQAAVSDRIYNINANARIVSTARNWRSYLEREWGEVTPPPDLLRPETPEEREIWIALIQRGWAQGREQADEIFKNDLNELNADFTGMIRYRKLLSQGIISPPYALQVDRGITGGGDELRIGDRAVEITGLPELKPNYQSWQPANR